MSENRWRYVLDLLTEDTYVPSQQLAVALDVSSRTIRSDLKELQEVLKKHGAGIESKPKIGNRLLIHNREAFLSFYKSLEEAKEDELPVTAADRVQYLLEYLLAAEEYVKIDDLCENLFISKSSISQDLKEVRARLQEYNLVLANRPNYGIKVEGREFDLRLCIANTTIDRVKLGTNQDKDQQKEILAQIADTLTTVFEEYAFRMSDVAFQNLIVHIYIAIKRVHEGCYVPLEENQLTVIQGEQEYAIAEVIVRRLQTLCSFIIPKSETGYIAIHLASKKIVELEGDGIHNIIIDNEVNEIVTHMLQSVYDSFKIDFMDDLELRMVLALHLVPFGVRMQYDMILRNPLLKEIKTRFTLAYSIAVSACDILHKYYHKNIQEDEIGYFALHFNLALERKKNVIAKKNILIVCSTGRGTAELLVYKFREEFGKYLDTIRTCDVLGIKKIDFTDIDYVIATVPIQTSVPVPILEVKYFLEDSDVHAVRRLLSEEKSTKMLQYFDERLFLCDIDAVDKEDALHQMVKRIKEVKDVPRNFYQCVMKRERQAVTEFGNMVAIPHPYKAITKDTFVCIAILRKPIVWDKKKVQLIYLMSMEDNPNRNLQLFYKITSKLLVNKNYVKEVLQKKDFQTLLQMFHAIEVQLEQQGG